MVDLKPIANISRKATKTAFNLTKEAAETGYFLAKNYRENKKAEELRELQMNQKVYYYATGNKGTPRKTWDGRITRSDGEAKLLHWFLFNNIECQYEELELKKRFWEGGNKRYFKPDFYLPKYNLIVEYCGMAGDYKYDQDTTEKMNYYKKRNFKAVFMFYEDLKNTKEAFLREYKLINGTSFPDPIEIESTYDILESRDIFGKEGTINPKEVDIIPLLMDRKERISINFQSTELVEVGIYPSKSMIERTKKVKIPEPFKGYRTGSFYTFEATEKGQWLIYMKNESDNATNMSITIRRDDY